MTLDHYLDDFILVRPSYSQDCKILMDAFFQVCKDLGVSIAEEKTCGPTTSLIFLGLVIDTHDLTVNIPIEKVRQLQALLLNCLRQVTLKEIQALVGHLIFSAGRSQVLGHLTDDFTMQHAGLNNHTTSLDYIQGYERI